MLPLRSRFALLALVLSLAACSGSSVAPTTASTPALYRPAEDLGPLFAAVQLAGVYPDSKTFVDAQPLESPPAIVAAYEAERSRPGFDLAAFVAERFAPPPQIASDFETDTTRSMEEHIRALWPVLTRAPDAEAGITSLLPLPNPYVVPGGRFREVYYWDSYFTMLGLVTSGRADLARGMVDNFADLVRTHGFIPNGNRTYYLTRSQPPFFSSMVALLAQTEGEASVLGYLDALEAEHAFWMRGEDGLGDEPGAASRHVVRVEAGVLNRYWDAGDTPRPESYREDFRLAEALPEAERPRLWKDLRSAAESGWDFSSRWFADGQSLSAIETTDVVPVDLNVLLHHLETTIARLADALGEPAKSAHFRARADARRAALLATFWDEEAGFFSDVYLAKPPPAKAGSRPTGRLTLAGLVPLYYGLATDRQAERVAERVGADFLKPGGFVTTLRHTGEQWDAPNGWPPLQWMTIRGLERYGQDALAAEGRDRWLALNRAAYERTGKMLEKYNVEDLTLEAGGGEYPNQDGFGWTNGVALALLEGLVVEP